MSTSPTHNLAQLFAEFPQVEAVALGGSTASGVADAASDLDLYVYITSDILLVEREAIVERSGGARRADLGLTFWGSGDVWFDATTDTEVDAMYFGAAWMAEQLDRVLVEHRATLGYTTCFWHTVRHSQVLYDPHGWFAALQDRSAQAYPEALRRNIIAFNHPVLRNLILSYTGQIEKALKRGDRVSVSHRLTALFASYFDVLFALNRTPHPGEKRLLAYASRCATQPEGMVVDVERVLSAPPETVMDELTRLLDRLDALLEREGFDPTTSRPKA